MTFILKPYCERYGRFLSLTELRLHDCMNKRRLAVIWKTERCLLLKMKPATVKKTIKEETTSDKPMAPELEKAYSEAREWAIGRQR